MTRTNDDAMVPSSPFDADLLYIFTDVLKINMTKKPLHLIPAGVFHYGVDAWEHFHVIDPLDVSTFTYPTNGNTRTNLLPSMVIRLQFVLKYIDDVTKTDSRDAKSYKSDDFKIYCDQSWKLKCSNSAAA